MFQLVELEDVVRVPPDRFGSSLENVALELLKQKYESTISPENGYLVLVTNVKVDKIGKIIPGDGATYHKVRFQVLSFFPLKQEIVEGEIVEVYELADELINAFVRESGCIWKEIRESSPMAEAPTTAAVAPTYFRNRRRSKDEHCSV